MGAFGYEEHENDDFLDFVEDDTSEKNLLHLLNTTSVEFWTFNAQYLVGILNLLASSEKDVIDKSIKEIALKYLQGNLEDELSRNTSSYRNKNERIAALHSQIQEISSS